MNALPDLNTLSLADLYSELSSTGLVERLLRLAYDEDLVGKHASGDITSKCWGAADRTLRTQMTLREPACIGGLAALSDLCVIFAPGVQLESVATDSERYEAGAPLAVLSGPASQILQLERPMLNLISRLSGIATLTRNYAELADPVRVLDTRKTTPGLRALEKYAVRCGGGYTHRMGLLDAVLLKDNHLAGCAEHELAALVREAARRAREDRPLRFIEVEVDSINQLEALLTLEDGVVDIVLLDNMPADVLGRAVGLRDRAGSRVLLEASGGVLLETIGAIAQSGVDRISVGALTHSATSIDIGLDAV
jgi:nicotinate-nucleotide pyrophosphorylase (carboxylating)